MSSPLGKLFGKSPIAPIQQHMQLAQESVQLLCELLAASDDQDWNRVAEVQSLIDSTAAEARALRRDIRRHLPRGLFLAIPRPDLLELLDIQERITLKVSDIAQPLVTRGMQFPSDIYATVDKFCSALAAAAGEALTAIRELDELINEGFGKHEHKVIERLIASLERRLKRCTTLMQRLLGQLSKSEDKLPVLDMVFYYQIARSLSDLAEACGDVGEQLDLLLAR